MTREEWKTILPILQAFVKGKAVQKQDCTLTDFEWIDVQDIDVKDLLEHTFRVKPDYRPFKDIDELIEAWRKINFVRKPLYTKPLIWIQNRFTNEVELITSFDYANSFHDDDRVETSTRVLTMDDLYREYKFLKGDICGVKTS